MSLGYRCSEPLGHGGGGSFIALEAQSYSGGRAHGVEVGHESVAQYVFDRGPNWVSGAGWAEGDTNSKRAPRGSPLSADDYVDVVPPAKTRLTARGCRRIISYTSYSRTNDCIYNGYVNSNLEHNTMINIDTVAHMNMHYTQY